MKPAILKKWVRALRSGKYKQGKEQLKIVNGIPRYCCLGVLCYLHAKATGKLWGSEVEPYLSETGILPRKVMHWAGLTSNDPVLEEKTDSSASELNDSGKRFTTIARLIEQAQKNKLI
jgi:hypothetical protein